MPKKPIKRRSPLKGRHQGIDIEFHDFSKKPKSPRDPMVVNPYKRPRRKPTKGVKI
jgi:hypothetical protein